MTQSGAFLDGRVLRGARAKSEMVRGERDPGYDLARFFAIVGMVIVNFQIVMTGAEHYRAPWSVLSSLLEGRAAALFVVLAGWGIGLANKNALESGDSGATARLRRRLFRRAFLLFVIGLAYFPFWPADILHYYGVYIALAACLLTAPSRVLFASACLAVIVFTALLLTFDYNASWDWNALTYADFWTPAGFVRNLFFNGFHPVFPWVAFLLLGMALGRLDMRKARRNIAIVACSATVLAEGGLFAARQYGASGLLNNELWSAFFSTSPMPPLPFYVVSASGSACAMIIFCLFLAERHHNAFWLRPCASTGQNALTLYVAHVILGMGLLEAAGRLRNNSPEFAFAAACCFCLAGVLSSLWWKSRYRLGPLEWAMRKIMDLP